MRLRLVRDGNHRFRIELETDNQEWVRASRWFDTRSEAVDFAREVFIRKERQDLAQQITVVATYDSTSGVTQ